jgi:hypothetical protein
MFTILLMTGIAVLAGVIVAADDWLFHHPSH